MKKNKDHGLLIASMVAIVAIVGLVMMFSNGTTGAVNFGTWEKRADQTQCYFSEGKMLCANPVTGEEYESTGTFDKEDGKVDIFQPSGVQGSRTFGKEEAPDTSIATP